MKEARVVGRDEGERLLDLQRDDRGRRHAIIHGPARGQHHLGALHLAFIVVPLESRWLRRKNC
jgi:hypothetical protein